MMCQGLNAAKVLKICEMRDSAVKLLMIEDNTSVAEMMAMFFQKENGKLSTPMMVKKDWRNSKRHLTALISLRLI